MGKRAKWRTETVYAICTLSAAQAQPRELARWLRDHWGIKNRLHWVRNVTLGEDLHQARTGSGPHALAIYRNLLISLLRLSGHTNIARAIRHHARHPDQAIALVASKKPTTQ
jgi:predicted transposase YbfD/YdcC